MTTPNASYGDILSTTIQLLEDDLIDNISNNNGLMYELKENGNVEAFAGGPAIVQPLEYAENSTYKRISGYETVDISPSQVFTAASFGIKQVVIAVSISELEEIQNAGPGQKHSLIKSRLKNLQNTFENNFSTDLYSDGTSDDGKQIGGLQMLIPDNPAAGTVGGISRATWTFWRTQYFRGVTDGGAAVGTASIQTYMNRLYLSMVTRKVKPTLGLADNNYYRYFEESLQAIQRMSQQQGKNKMAEAGFESYLYKGIPIVFDGGVGGACPANHMYFINGKHLRLRPYKGKMLREPIGGDRHAVNQLATVKLRTFAGNTTISNGRHMGVLIA